VLDAVAAFGALAGLAASAYLVVALWHVARWRPAVPPAASPDPVPVTILKPVCGAEPRLYDCLRSFCALARPDTQLVFGVADPADAAVPVIRRLIAEFPGRDLALVVDAATHGANRKVGNLVNMMAQARHDLIVVSDSDSFITDSGLASLLAPFADPRVGAATCLYRSAPDAHPASLMGAMFIDSWFLPAAIVNAGLRPVSYCFGPLLAVRRSVLEEIGGFRALRDHLADDFMLGKLVVRAGHRVALAGHVAETVVAETWRTLVAHELRWARTARVLYGSEHLLSVVTCATPLAWLALFGPAWLAATAIGVPTALRLALHALVRRRAGIATRAPYWLLPVRELLYLAIWTASLFGSAVEWRGQSFTVAPGGVLVPKGSRA
jgi:ceramide glucosyltransferase